MADDQDLRPFLTRLINRILHVPREPPTCSHCHHVTEHATTIRIHNKLLFIVIGAVVSLLVRWAAIEISSRLADAPPPIQPGNLLPGVDGKR